MSKAARACLVPALIALGACATRTHPVVVPVALSGAFPASLTVRLSGRNVSIPLEEYVAGCVFAELGSIDAGPAAAARARDVQAILCRSFATSALGRHRAEGADLCDSTHCQVYRAAPNSVIGRLAREAAERTAGQVLTYRGQPVRPLYHAHCGGRTSPAESVWEGPGQPYFVSRPDTACRLRRAWAFSIELADLLGALPAQTVSALGSILTSVEVRDRDRAGRAALLWLRGDGEVTIRGDAFRLALVRRFGIGSVRSTLFTITRIGSRLTFRGRGDGHGVGLCQAGALGRAVAGESPARILAHYFPGTAVARTTR